MRRHWRLWTTLVLLTLVGGVSLWQQQAATASPTGGPATVAILRTSSWPAPDAEVEALVRQAVGLAGGLEAIITPGDTVVIKPNLVWGASPDEGYTTDPRVVRALVRMAREIGAGQVIIAEGSATYRDGRNARGATADAFARCGYDANRDMLDDATGVRLVDLNDAGGLDQHDPNLVTRVAIPNGLIWSAYWLPNTILQADVLITVPVLKNHSYAGVTLALKNQIGIAPSDIYHSPGLQVYKSGLSHSASDLGRHIVDLNLARRPDFVVVDGLRGMIDGPTGGTLANPAMRLILASADPVAADTVGALVMGYDPTTIPYIGWAAGAGLGTNDPAQITIRGLRVSQVRRNFPAPYGNPPAQRAETTPPTVQITTPEWGAVVTEQTTVAVNASDNRGVARVEFYVDGALQASDVSAPYQATLDLGPYRGGSVGLRVVAYDRALNDAAAETRVAVVRAPAPGTASFQTATLTIPTYPYAHCLQTRNNGPYTYQWLDWGCYGTPTPTPSPRDYTLLVLENDFLRVTILPELGGRVYQMIYKPTGSNELYQNPVIKPTNWGPPEQGWWLAAGGIEWCLPVDEHGYEWGEPWAWSVVTSTAGVTVTVRDTLATDRLRTAVDLFLPAGRGYLAIAPRLENPTASTLAYKFWLNGMLAPGPQNRPTSGLEFAFNAEQMAVHSTGDCRLPGCWTQPTGPSNRFTWPIYSGVDYSRLANWREWLGFFEYPQAAADFIGVYSRDAGEGMARAFPAHIARGAKGFAPGWSNPIDWHQWTDDGSGAVELHGGVAPTFWDQATLAAGQVLSWTEYWYPTGNIGALSAATPEAALGVRAEGGNLIIGVHPTAVHGAGESHLYVWDRNTCAELGHWSPYLVGPANPLRVTVASGGRSVEQVSVAYLDNAGNLLAGFHTHDCLPPEARVDPLPPWVETATFTVTWSGEDIWSDVTLYQVQVRDGYEGNWTTWLEGTTATSASFSGTHGHTYFFRARARDSAGNWGAFTDEEWGQAFTSVLTQPAPVLVTSRKTCDGGTSAWCPHQRPDRAITYTVSITNSGNLTGTAVLSDTPPVSLTLLAGTLSASSAPPPTWDGMTIGWSGNIPPGAAVRVTYALLPHPGTPRLSPLTNTAWISGSVLGPLERRARIVVAWPLWLPTVSR